MNLLKVWKLLKACKPGLLEIANLVRRADLIQRRIETTLENCFCCLLPTLLGILGMVCRLLLLDLLGFLGVLVGLVGLLGVLLGFSCFPGFLELEAVKGGGAMTHCAEPGFVNQHTDDDYEREYDDRASY